MKVCAECKFFKKNSFDETKFHTCTHIEYRHPVSGFGQACVELRKKTGSCGIVGTYWVLGFVGQVIATPLKIVRARKTK